MCSRPSAPRCCAVSSPTGAERRWPEVTDRKALLLRLAAAGAEAIATDAEKRREEIDATAGALTGVYEPGELERLREDWPA